MTRSGCVMGECSFARVDPQGKVRMGQRPSRRSPQRSPGLHLRLFGALELRRGGRILPPLATHKTQSLLAYLVLHRVAPQPRERLAAIFWGDQSDPRARRSLATALWRLRTVLPANYLLVDSNSIQFDPDSSFWLDVAEFDHHLQLASREAKASLQAEHLSRAVALYRGDLLEGFYDDWCIEERYRLETAYLETLKRLVAHSEAQGDFESVHSYADKYLARDPLEASLYLTSMRAWMALGKGNEARHQWRQCCDTWEQELHSAPPPELAREAARILGIMFTSAAPGAATPAPIRRRGSLDSPPFVGRTTELNVLQAQWEQVAQSRGGSVLISGEAGVGKTRLIDEFVARVRYQGGLVARGRCWEPERNLAYQPLVEILQQLNLNALSALPEWARQELERLVPDLRRARENDAGARPDLRLGQSALLNAIASAFRQLAEQAPLLVILEDVHTAAESTIAALSFLARRTGHAHMLLLASYRTEEVESGSVLLNLIVQLTRDGFALPLPLERLSAGATAELVQALRSDGNDPVLAARLHKHTQGNPLFLIETLRAMQEHRSTSTIPVPTSVSQLIDRRLNHIGPRTYQLLASAAVVGQAFDFDIVSSAADLDEEPALEAMDELLRRGFVRENSGSAGQDYEFEHPLIQQVVYAGIHRRRRQRLHRLVGEALEHANFAQLPLALGQIAYHFDRAQVGDKALAYAEQAVDASWDLGTPAEVAHFSEVALRWLERIGKDRLGAAGARTKAFDLRLELEEALDILGRREDQIAVLQVMSDLAEQLDDNSRRALVHIRRFWFYYTENVRQAYAEAEIALALSEQLGNHSAFVQAQYITALAWAALGEPGRGLPYARRAVASARALPDQVLEGWSLLQLGYIFKQLGDWESAQATFAESCAVNRARGNPFALSRTLLHLGDVCQKLGATTQARQHYEQALALSQEIGYVRSQQEILKRLGNDGN